MKIDEAEFHAYRLADAVDAKSAAGEEWSLAERVTARADMGAAVRLAKQAVDMLAAASGGSSVYASHPMRGIQQDVQAISLHALMNPDTNAELYGRTLCGQPEQPLHLRQSPQYESCSATCRGATFVAFVDQTPGGPIPESTRRHRPARLLSCRLSARMEASSRVRLVRMEVKPALLIRFRPTDTGRSCGYPSLLGGGVRRSTPELPGPVGIACRYRSCHARIPAGKQRQARRSGLSQRPVAVPARVKHDRPTS